MKFKKQNSSSRKKELQTWEQVLLNKSNEKDKQIKWKKESLEETWDTTVQVNISQDL